MHGITLSHLPPSAKVFCTLFLLGIGLGSLAAFAQAATAIGLSYGDVVASLAPEMPMTHMRHDQWSTEKEIDISQLRNTSKVWIRMPLLIQTCTITGSNLWVCSASGETLPLMLFTMSRALNALDPDSIFPFSAAHISSVRSLRAPQD